MRTYLETLDYLFSRLPMFTRLGAVAYKKDLTNTIALCAALDQPQKKFKSIHIAGTNGKGSSSHMLASILQAQGYKTGLYTSPHLRDFRERIRINGAMISEQEVIEFTEKMEQAIAQIEPSFFELTMVMAFEHFVNNEVDIAIIETGMGGRLDSTNIIEPELCLITNIGYDHMEFLGNDLPSIAAEKAGIIKHNTPIIIAKTQAETRDVFEKVAKEKEAPVFFADQIWASELEKRTPHYQQFSVQRLQGNKESLELDLLGAYQQANLMGVLEAVYQLNKGAFPCSTQAIQNGLKTVQTTTGLMGRWQLLSEKPRIVCDTGHNEDGIKEVLKMLANESYETLHFVVGLVKDKEVSKVLKLLPSNAKYYFTQASIPRALEASELHKQAMEFGLIGENYPKVKEALEAAKMAAKSNDLIFVGGSTFVVAEVV